MRLGSVRVMAHFIRTGEARPTPELVTRAVARAKAGDMSAIHFLYVRFADDVFGYVKQHRARFARG